MALIIKKASEATSSTMKAKQTWYVDADGKPTLDASKAAEQITEKGIEILPHIVSQYGFEDGDLGTKKAKVEKEVEKAVEPKEAKMTAPTENKAKKK